jgi:hypothetical protein
MINVNNAVLSIIVLFVHFSCAQKKSVDTTSENEMTIDTIASLAIDTLNALPYLNYSKQIDTGKIGEFIYEIDYLYDSLDELILQNTDSLRYISIGTDQGEGGINAVWYFNSVNEIVGLSYHLAFESQQIELEYLIRGDIIIGYTRIDYSGYCHEVEKWCIEMGGYSLGCDKIDSLSTDFDKQIEESFRNYKIELQQFLNLPIVESKGDIYWLRSDIEENENYDAYVTIPKKLYEILIR